METEIHTSHTTEMHQTSGDPQGPSWREKEAFKTLEAIRPYLSWVIMGIMAVVTLYVSFHDANAEQVNAIKEVKARQDSIENQIVSKGAARDKQLDTLGMRMDGMVDKDLFNERTNNMQKELDQIRDDQKEILNRLPMRPLP